VARKTSSGKEFPVADGVIHKNQMTINYRVTDVAAQLYLSIVS